jgi:hypothetical protein
MNCNNQTGINGERYRCSRIPNHSGAHSGPQVNDRTHFEMWSVVKAKVPAPTSKETNHPNINR